MKYLFIDTNIYIQCCLLEIEGDDIGALEKVHKLLDKNKVKLILPEVVRLEFPNALNNKTEQLKLLIGKHKEEINLDKKLDNKIRHELTAKLDETMQERISNTNRVKKEIDLIFNNTNTVSSIKINSRHFTEAYKRFLSGEKPYNDDQEGEIQPDSLIIEGIIDYFKNKKNYDFFFCSLNEKDFGIKDNANVKTHPDIEKNFEKIKYYSNLYSLLNEEFSGTYSAESIAKLEDKKQEATTFAAISSGIAAGHYRGTSDLTGMFFNDNRSNHTSAFMPTDASLTGTHRLNDPLHTVYPSTSLLNGSGTNYTTAGIANDPSSLVVGGVSSLNGLYPGTVLSLCKRCGSSSFALDEDGYCSSCKHFRDNISIN